MDDVCSALQQKKYMRGRIMSLVEENQRALPMSARGIGADWLCAFVRDPYGQLKRGQRREKLEASITKKS